MLYRLIVIGAVFTCISLARGAANDSVGQTDDVTVGGFVAVTFGDNDGTLTTLHGNVEWFAATNLALAIQPFGGNIDGETDDVGVVGFDLLLKWYPVHGKNWAFYIEGGAGAQYTFPRSFPDGGSHFNFRPQAGIGGLIHLTDRLDMLGGARYIHMSNANVNEPNEGYDGILMYLGASLHF